MNIKQAEQQSGVARQNIRYYESVGLICPARNPENDYREYDAADIRTLKLIRALRMLDMPVEEIRAVISGKTPLAAAAGAQQKRLLKQADALLAAGKFCEELAKSKTTTQNFDVDAALTRMESTATGNGGWFTQWVNDYRSIALTEHEKYFTFIPDTPVRTPQGFTAALFAYAKEQNLNLTVTVESMTPHFTINGIEYTATRFTMPVRGLPVDTVRCRVAHPEDFEAPNITPARRRWQKNLHYAWPAAFVVAFVLFQLAGRGVLNTWWGWLMALAMVASGISGLFYHFITLYNEGGKRGARR